MENKEVSLEELVLYFNAYLECYKFQESAYNGVQVTTTRPITKIVTAVSASVQAIEKAVEEKAQLLIVHHGIFRKDDKHPLQGNLYKKIKLLMDHDIALLCYHLPLDAHQEVGNNWKAARDLGLLNLQPFLEYSGSMIGVVGIVSACSFHDFLQKVEKYYERPAQIVQVKSNVTKVAIVSGAAEKFIKDAALVGADCFITGRADEQVYDDANEFGVSYIGVGHYGSETVGVRALATHLTDKFGIEALFYKTDNPF